MLRIIQNTHVNGAKSYYSTASAADYYSEGQELTGRWRGEAARRLGLHGNVKQAEWDALCDNTDPHTGKQLTARLRKDRTIGYDFNFHVPKSVSILYGMTRDERILEAFRDSVDSTMRDMESEMSARVRKGGKDENRRTGNMVWGEYIHLTSRPVDGVPDCHVHAHCFVFNLTHDDKEQAWKAGQFRELKRDAPYFEAVFHSRLAHRLHDLGLPIARTKKGWELDGLDKGLLRKFSRRRAQIEEVARDMGIEDPAEWAELGAKTRQRKQKDLTVPQLQDVWQSRMSAPELDAVAALDAKLGGDADPADPNASARALKYAVGHVFERRSVVPRRELLASALKHSVGQATVEQVLSQADRSDLIIGERNGRQMATHRDVLNEESRVIDFARKGRGACRAFSKSHESFKRDWLNDAQKSAVRHIVGSRDRVMLLRGSAGVGKTTLMQEAVEELEEAGTKVFAFAPSADASRGVLRDAGFKDADTVARLLVDEKLQRQVAGQLIWVDEASLLPMKTMDQLFALAEKMETRVLLSGDRRQHGSVERGSALRLLEEEAGLVPAEVKEIKRQSGSYKEAVKALSEGRVAEGFKRLDHDLNWVREIPDDERDRHLAADYVQAVRQGKSALVVSPTHAEGHRITTEIRRSLRQAGKLGDDERNFTILENANLTEAERGDAINYAPGDVLQFHQNARGFMRGERVTVDGDRPLPLNHAARFQAFHATSLRLAPGDVVRITRNGWTIGDKHRLNNGSLYRIDRFDRVGNIVLENGWTIGKDFGHLAHGYVITSHAAEGKTVDCVFVGQSSLSFPASSREQFYVSCSRARQRVTIYTDDKEALREAIDQSDERVSATELVSGNRQREMVALRESHRDMSAEAQREREGLTYDR